MFALELGTVFTIAFVDARFGLALREAKSLCPCPARQLRDG
jgi:hypothetical protein